MCRSVERIFNRLTIVILDSYRRRNLFFLFITIQNFILQIFSDNTTIMINRCSGLNLFIFAHRMMQRIRHILNLTTDIFQTSFNLFSISSILSSHAFNSIYILLLLTSNCSIQFSHILILEELRIYLLGLDIIIRIYSLNRLISSYRTMTLSTIRINSNHRSISIAVFFDSRSSISSINRDRCTLRLNSRNTNILCSIIIRYTRLRNYHSLGICTIQIVYVHLLILLL